MDRVLQERLDEIDRKLGQAGNFHRVRLELSDKTYEDEVVIQSGNYTFDFENLLERPPDAFRIVANKDCTLEYNIRKGEEARFRRYPEGLLMNIPLRVRGEGWRRIRVTPSVYPCTVKVYASVVKHG